MLPGFINGSVPLQPILNIVLRCTREVKLGEYEYMRQTATEYSEWDA
jgi:hypothetical protein